MHDHSEEEVVEGEGEDEEEEESGLGHASPARAGSASGGTRGPAPTSRDRDTRRSLRLFIALRIRYLCLRVQHCIAQPRQSRLPGFVPLASPAGRSLPLYKALVRPMLGALKRRLLRLGEQCTAVTGTGNFRARALAIQRLLSSRVSSQALPLEFLLNPKQNTVARTVFQRYCGTLKSGFYTGSAIQFHVPKVRLQHVAVRHGPGVGGSTPPELQVASGQGDSRATGKAHDGHLSPAQATARTLGPSLHTPRVQYGREAPEARSPGEVKRKMVG